MSKPFIHENFLLDTPLAQKLYHQVAAPLPIIDYHCHLSPRQIAEDQRWPNLTALWLHGDHYKWRAMRTAGVAERYCTGDASDWEKFQQFARIMPCLLRNPLYHWSHLELARYFQVFDLLNADSARSIYEACNQQIQQPDFTCRSLLVRMHVEVVCTTDDPVDSLQYHRQIQADASFNVQVRPTWRPDKALMIDRPELFTPWLAALEQAASLTIHKLDDLLQALQLRHDYFASCGCLLSDRGLETLYAEDCTFSQAAQIFTQARLGQPITADQLIHYRSFMLHELALMDARKNWTMQIHYGALRNNNTRMRQTLGPDTGFDSIGDWPVASALARHLDRLDQQNLLPRTILYNLNPRDNELLAAMIGNFQDGSIPGKIQFGSGWWFNDQLDGMSRQLEALSQMSLLGTFVGMLTDSRSFLSYTRHEYFRRLLCQILAHDVQQGLIPDDFDLVAELVRNVCYHNARRYFGFFW